MYYNLKFMPYILNHKYKLAYYLTSLCYECDFYIFTDKSDAMPSSLSTKNVLRSNKYHNEGNVNK